MRRNLKVLGLSFLALLGLMAVSVSAAQAEGEWLENLEPITELKEVLGEFLNPGRLVVHDLGIEIACPAAAGKFTGSIEPGGKSKGTLSVDGSQCLVWFIDGETLELIEELTTCEVDIADATFTDLLVLHEGEVYDVFSSLEGEPFTIITFLGEECPLNEFEAEVTGNTSVLLDPEEEDTVLHTLKFGDSAVEDLLETGLFFGENPAVLDAELSVHLVSENPWGAH